MKIFHYLECIKRKLEADQLEAWKILPLIAVLFSLAVGWFAYPELDAPSYRWFAKHPELRSDKDWRVALNRGPGLILWLYIWPKDFRLALFTLSSLAFVVYRRVLKDKAFLGITRVVVAFWMISYENVPAALTGVAGAYKLLEAKDYRDYLVGAALLWISSTFRFDIPLMILLWLRMYSIILLFRKDLRGIFIALSSSSVLIPIHLWLSWAYTSHLSISELRARLSANDFYLLKMMSYYYAVYLFASVPIILFLIAYNKDWEALLPVVAYYIFYVYATSFNLHSSIRYTITLALILGPRVYDRGVPHVELFRTYVVMQTFVMLYRLFYADRRLSYLRFLYGLPLLGIIMASLAVPILSLSKDHKDVFSSFHFIFAVIYISVLYNMVPPMGLWSKLYNTPGNRL